MAEHALLTVMRIYNIMVSQAHSTIPPFSISTGSAAFAMLSANCVNSNLTTNSS